MKRITRRRSASVLPPSFPVMQKEKRESTAEPVLRPCFRIDHHGNWFYHEKAILRKEMVCLLAATLNRLPDGRYMVDNPMVGGDVDVEDAPFIVEELYIGGVGEKQKISLLSNVDQMLALDETTPLRYAVDNDSGLPALYVTLRDGLEARLSFSACRSLAKAACTAVIDEKSVYGVWSDGVFFPLPELTAFLDKAP